MAWTKAPLWLVELFDACLPDDPGVQRRKMFGFPSAFAGGHLFAGLFQDAAFARLPQDVRARLESEFGVRDFEPMPGRPMRAYAVLPEAVLEDEARLVDLLRAAYVLAASLPPKVKTPRKTRS